MTASWRVAPALAVVAITLAATPGARAAAVSLVPSPQPGATGFLLTYAAAPGEANRLTLEEAPDGRSWTFRDRGATVQAGASCAARLDGAVVCTATGGPVFASVDLGDGDDVADVAAPHSGVGQLETGAGDDVLRARAGPVSAALGPGDDRADVEAGSLSVEGGPGADEVDAARGASLQVTYFASDRGVHVTLDGRANDGAPGEHDDVSPLTRTLNGSAHADVLDARAARTKVAVYGEAGDDRQFASPSGGFLAGGAGRDVLHGGAGPDGLLGELGDDVLLGGRGDDELTGDNGHDLLVGGPGRDRLAITYDGRDTVRARDGGRDRVTCEWLPHSLQVDRVDRLDRCAFLVGVSAQPPVTPHRRLRLMLRCPWQAPGGCRGSLVVFDSRPRPLGRTRYVLAAGAVRSLAVELGHEPRDLVVAVVTVARRVPPPASRRTAVTTIDLAPP